MDNLPSTVPTLTLAHSRAAEPAPLLLAGSPPVDPATRTGCAWYVVPVTLRAVASPDPHAA